MNNFTLIVGCDPGISGALALYHTNGFIVECYDIPTVIIKKGKKKKKNIDTIALAAMIKSFHNQGASRFIIEKVGSMPGQGVSSSFRFGEATGLLKGIALGLGMDVEEVRPQVWKKHYQLNKDKYASLQLAREMFPEVDLKLKKDHNKAEACLIAKV